MLTFTVLDTYEFYIGKKWTENSRLISVSFINVSKFKTSLQFPEMKSTLTSRLHEANLVYYNEVHDLRLLNLPSQTREALASR